MKKVLGMATATVMSLSSHAMADGSYKMTSVTGTEFGHISFQNTVGDDTVWVWPHDVGAVTFYIHNPQGINGDWSGGVYEGIFTIDKPDHYLRPCRYAIHDPYGQKVKQWGTVRMTWNGADEFRLKTWKCDTSRVGMDAIARYHFDQGNDPVVPVSARIDLQSYEIPISYDDPAYTVQGLDKSPGISLTVELSDGSQGGFDYQKYDAGNIVFDDVSGDPDDLIEVKYWNINPNDPGQGQYAAQLTSTGNGTGVAELRVSFRDAPDVFAAATVSVVSAAPQIDAPVSGSLELQSYTLPVSRWDQAAKVSGLDVFTPIYVSAILENGAELRHFYHQEFADNVIIDDVSGDPDNLIEVVDIPVDYNVANSPMFQGELTATGRGTGTATLQLSFKNAPGVTASIAVNVVSGVQ